MTTSRRLVLLAGLIAPFFIAGCALPARTLHEYESTSPIWRGRLAIQVDADMAHDTQASSFSAGFELEGNAQAGGLILSTPLGGTAAQLKWSDSGATLHSSGKIQQFASLTTLIEHVTGTELPVAALFAWLAGENKTANGWQADLSQLAQGRLWAQRINPAPAAQLRLILEE